MVIHETFVNNRLRIRKDGYSCQSGGSVILIFLRFIILNHFILGIWPYFKKSSQVVEPHSTLPVSGFGRSSCNNY